MNSNLVQREVKTLCEDLTELAKTLEDHEPQGDYLRGILTCVQQRLLVLVNYIQSDQVKVD